MPSPRRIFVQLGRMGDILNALPLALEYKNRTQQIPLFMVAKEFSGILDGVSYVEPLIFDGPFEDVNGALWEASKLSTDIILTQIYGKGINYPRTASSFARESWYRGGAQIPWGSVSLVIDRRDKEREAKLITKVVGDDDRYFVLTALKGKSSPFPYAKQLLRDIQDQCGMRVIDISDIRAERFFDLLALFERAVALVSIDTGHLHLAAACHVPVIALCTRDPTEWHGTPWRPNFVRRFMYDEFPASNYEVSRILIDELKGKPRIVHAYTRASFVDMDKQTQRRNMVSINSWDTEYKTNRWLPCVFTEQHAIRDAKVIGEKVALPFVHDVIRYGLSRMVRDDDILALTNSDVGFVPGLTGKIFEGVARYGACYTHRIDFDQIKEPFIHDSQIQAGEFYPGSDAFFMSKAWLDKHLNELGDYVWGREFWDQGLRQLIKYHGGREIRKAIYHERHDSAWQDLETRETLPGNAFNRTQLQSWFDRTGLSENDHSWWQVNPEFFT